VGVESEQIRSLRISDQPDHYGGEKKTEPNPLAPTESHAANLPVSLIALANARRREAGFRLCGQSEPEPARSAPTAAAYRSQAAHRVIAVTPWYGYSRQDKKSAPREPISARLVAHMLESAGIDRILTMDLHSGQIQGFFDKPCDHMTALFILTQYFSDLGLDDLVVVAPDVGRVKLNKLFASKMGADLAILNKERPLQQVAEISYVIGDAT